ncbi:MAG: putative 2-aminoethylphosphonate ABC transporter ATP-binding protein [Alphaproteobacteria bacterium]|nr:putative 2-aminoethylphosphonate ABC transporter ATP-binding protein [Alphaproteobacteria bacterium]
MGNPNKKGNGVHAKTKSEPYLSIRELSKMFGTFTALQDIALDINEGEFVCFLGPSGCGKTTLLRAIAGLDIQTTGTVIQAGQDISALPPSERDFGIVFQSYALFPNLTVNRNVAYGLENARLAKNKITSRVTELLSLVGLPDQGPKYPAQLSGGQQQRVALARALATSPGLLLLDEPLSALDAQVRVHLRHEIKLLQDRLGVTTVMVTHDQEEALSMADRIVVMNHGVIEQVGTPTEIYTEPATLFVADFIGEMNHLSGDVTAAGKVKVGTLPLTCATADLAKGQAVIATIRPEDIVVKPSKGAKKAANTAVLTVEELEFLGSFWRVELSAPSLGDNSLSANISINNARSLALEPGSKVSAEFPAERIRVFPAVG